MKKRFVILMTVCAVCFIGLSASAQEKFKMELSYNVSVPVGSFKNDYIGKTSFRGGTGMISYTFNPKFSLGLSSGYQNYYQKYGRQLYKLDGNQTVSAVLTNSMDIVPILFRGTFYPLGTSTSMVQPYVSAGAGVNLINYGQYLGEFGGTESSTAFAAQAGAGIKIPFGKGPTQNGIKIGATYNYSNYNNNDVSKLNNVGINAGVIFGLK
ncbi:outer membrane beta-barrel protein [Segetibacter koreensis]|uniref:outer membrane beta-barrel protein n=1 Tax=Segetibacter koreensis TaxID=398037 RepID=UPI00037CD021|nr:outer membrane beta-barrel protein [Segetibacter koreensis]